MAVTSGFFDAINHDRLYNAEEVGSLLDGVIDDGILNITDGIVNAYGAHFEVTHVSGLDINVASGRGWFKRTWIKNDDNLVLSVPFNGTGARRIDTVVIDVNKTDDVRANTIQIVVGTTSQPALIDEAAHKQYPLANIIVEAQGTNIESIVDRRKEIYASPSSIINDYYPVGSVYMSMSNTNPREILGGVWEQICGRFLIGCGGDSGLNNSDTGGSWTHTISVNQMPSHNHNKGTLYVEGAYANVKLTNPMDNGLGTITVMGWADEKANYIDTSISNYLPAAWNYACSFQGAGTIEGPFPPVATPYITTQTHLDQPRAHNHLVYGSTGETGGGQPVEVKPPYLAVYMWHRIS